MKKTLSLTTLLSAVALLALMPGCETTGSSTASAASQKETMLKQAGFKTGTATTAHQQQQLATLPAGKVSAVKANGKLFYVYPTATKNQVLVGKQAHYNAYKQSKQAAMTPAQQGQQQMAGYADMSEETAGPNHIMVNEYDGFGPMNDSW